MNKLMILIFSVVVPALLVSFMARAQGISSDERTLGPGKISAAELNQTEENTLRARRMFTTIIKNYSVIREDRPTKIKKAHVYKDEAELVIQILNSKSCPTFTESKKALDEMIGLNESLLELFKE